MSADSAWRREVYVLDDTTAGSTSIIDYVRHAPGPVGGTVDEVNIKLTPDGKVAGGRMRRVLRGRPAGWRAGVPRPDPMPWPTPLTPGELARTRALAAWLRSRCRA